MVIHNRIKDVLSKNPMIPLLKIRRRVNSHLPAPSAIFPLGPKDVYNGENISYHIHWILTYLFSSDLIFPLFWSVLSWSLWLSLDISSSLEMQNHFIYIENKTELKTPLKTATIIMTHFVSRSNTFFVLCSRLCANLFFSDMRPSMSSNLQKDKQSVLVTKTSRYHTFPPILLSRGKSWIGLSSWVHA